MHENKFEKQVQEKMEGLQFAPSDAVWQKVDEEINKDKKRRRPLFWLFFFLGMLLLGGGYFFVDHKTNKIQESKVQENKAQESKAQEGREQRDKLQPALEQRNGKHVINEEEDKAGENKKNTAKLSEDGLQADKKQKEEAPKNYSVLYNPRIKNILADKKNKTASVIKPEKHELAAQKKRVPEKEKNMATPQSAAAEDNDVIVIDNYKKSANKVESGVKNKNHFDSSLNNITNAVADNKTIITDSAADKKIARSNSQTKKSSVWKIGYTAHAGISNINQSLFKSTYVTDPAYYANAPTGPNGPPVYASSPINPGFSFGAGVFVNKNLSKRISFSAGLNYHYYSTRINIGSSVDSAIYVYPSVSASVTTPVRVSSYYRNGNTKAYMNHYHFIELPLSINFQLNKSRKIPLIWEGGFSVSYLINSNALHFDPVTGVYYKNNSLLNKTQFNTATAIMVGFHLHKNALLLGPQLQYGLTRLLNKNTGNPEHLFFAGLKLSFIPGKK